MPVSRRQFLAGSAAAGTSLFLYQFVGGVKTVLAVIPGGTLDPTAVTKFATPLLIPPVMPAAGQLPGRAGASTIDYYEIAVRQFRQQVLPPGNARSPRSGSRPPPRRPRPRRCSTPPSFTIEAQLNRPARG